MSSRERVPLRQAGRVDGSGAAKLRESQMRGPSAAPAFAPRVQEARCPVVLVGDQPLAMAGLRAMLERDAELELVGEVAGSAAALQAVPAGDRVVVFATGAWTPACAEALAVLRARHSDATVVLLVGDADPARMRQFMAAGGHAALPLSAEVGTVLAAVRTAKPETGSGHTVPIGLSGREALVLRGKVNGQTNKAIAASLGLSVKTVETYYARATEKLGLQTRAQVVHYAVQQGWLAP